MLLKYHKDDCAENLDALRSTQRVLGTALIKEKALTGSTQAIIRFFDDCKLTHKNVDINNELEHVEFDEAELARHASLLDF